MERHPACRWRAGLALVVAALAAVGLLRFAPASTAPSTTGGSGAASQEQEQAFGGEAILVSIEGPLGSTLSPTGISELIALEGRLSRLEGVANVVGPGGFINQSTIQADRLVTARLGPAARRASRAGDRARRSARSRGVSAADAAAIGDRARVAALGADRSQFERALSRLGGIGLPSIANPAYVNAIVFGRDNVPKPRFRWLFPDAQHAVILVRPVPGLSAGTTKRLGGDIRSQVARADVRGARVTVGGPTLADADAAARIPFALALSLGIALVLGGLVFVGIFRTSARTVAAAAGVGSGCTVVGLLAASALVPRPGVGLLIAGPVVAAVCVGVVLRMWLCAQEPSVGRSAVSPTEAVLRPLLPVGAALVGVAVLAQLSGVALLAHTTATTAIGVLIGLAAATLVLPIALRVRRTDADDRLELRGWIATRRATLARVRDVRPAGGRTRRALRAVVAVLLIAGIGVMATTEVGIVGTTPERAQSTESRRATTIVEQTGVAQELRIALHGDVTAPESVVWLNRLGKDVRRVDGGIVVGPNIGELLSNGARPSQARIDALYEVTPAYLLRPMITPDRRTAQLRLALPARDPATLRRIVREVADATRTAPEGLRASVTGRLADAARAEDRLRTSHLLVLLGALILIAGVSLRVTGDRHRAIATAAPAFAGTGAIGCALGVLQIDVTAQTTVASLVAMVFGLLFAVGTESPHSEAIRRNPRAARTRRPGAMAAPLVFCCAAFVAVATSGFASTEEFGVLTAVGVLASAAVLAAGRAGRTPGGRRIGVEASSTDDPAVRGSDDLTAAYRSSGRSRGAVAGPERSGVSR